MQPGPRGQNSALSYAQQNIFITSLRHIDRLLSDIEGIVDADDGVGVLARFHSDLDAREKQQIHRALGQFRQTILDSMHRIGITEPKPQVAAFHAIETNLDFIEIDIEELRPRYMKAYGTLTPEAAAGLNAVLDTLQDEARSFRRILDTRRASR
jgi:hypothetical protein